MSRNDSMYMKGGNSDAEKAAYKLGYEDALSEKETEIAGLKQELEYFKASSTAYQDAYNERQKEVITHCATITKLREGLEAGEKYIEYLVLILNYPDKRDNKKMFELFTHLKQLLQETNPQRIVEQK